MPNEARQIDQQGMTEWNHLIERIGPRFAAGYFDILENGNRELLAKMWNLWDRADSQLMIVNKPKQLRKRWLDYMDELERVANCAIAYAARHAQPEASGREVSV